MGCRTRFLFQTISLRLGLKSAEHWIFSNEAHNPSHGCDDDKKDDHHNDSRVNPAQDVPQLHPTALNWRQNPGEKNRRDNQQAGQEQSRGPHACTVNDSRPQSDQAKDPTDDESKLTKLSATPVLHHKISFQNLSRGLALDIMGLHRAVFRIVANLGVWANWAVLLAYPRLAEAMDTTVVSSGWSA